MDENKDFLDSDDIRVRGGIDLHPIFYWRAMYDTDKDVFQILPFMRINNSDTGRADWMDVQVSEKHKIQYRKKWEEFIEKHKLHRFEFTRDEMMHIQQFRDKVEIFQNKILLPQDHPEYWKMISDFSIKLNPEDVIKLNSLDGITEPVIEKATKGKDDKILDALSMIADKLDSLDRRVTDIENKQ
ncbi:MAG: hypothetical protein II238_00840 [Alphaproteobacteria bacterium]|nr:hypothetical protein [Alphaproteobacteria bacterium]